MADMRASFSTILNQFSSDATRQWWGFSGDYGVVVLDWQENKDPTVRTFFSFSTGRKHVVPIDRWGPPSFVFVKQFVTGLPDSEVAVDCLRAFSEARAASESFKQIISNAVTSASNSSGQELSATWNKEQSDRLEETVRSLRRAKLAADRELALKQIATDTFALSDSHGLVFNTDCWIRLSISHPTYVTIRLWISAANPAIWGVGGHSPSILQQSVQVLGASDANHVQRIIDNQDLFEMAAEYEGDLLGLISSLNAEVKGHAVLVEAAIQRNGELATALASDSNLNSYPAVKAGVWAAKTKRGLIVGQISRGNPHNLKGAVTVFNQTHGWAMRIGNEFLAENIVPPEVYFEGNHDLDDASRWIGEKLAEADWNIAVHSSSYNASDWYGGNKNWSSKG